MNIKPKIRKIYSFQDLHDMLDSLSFDSIKEKMTCLNDFNDNYWCKCNPFRVFDGWINDFYQYPLTYAVPLSNYLLEHGCKENEIIWISDFDEEDL